MKRWVIAICFVALPALGQVNNGELHVAVTDPSGHPVKTSVAVTSTGNQYANTLSTDASGRVAVKTLPYGLYVIRVQEPGFSAAVRAVEVRSPIPAECSIPLEIAQVATSVTVEDSDTLIDPHSSSSIMQIGSKQIEERLISLPGRSVQDLVNSQPGWLYEGNAVLHPRGSEYQTQFVIDGIPLTDNRSPRFGPEVEADDVNSMSIYTAGFPAEYGRKMGGVVEINTKRETNAGLHGQFVLYGGSYDTAAGFGHVQDVWGKNTLGGTASGSMTSRYLNPVVPENFTNKGTTGHFSVRYERDFTERDRLSATVRHELSRFLIPNELLQQTAGQVQNGDNFETLGAMSYQHIFSPVMLGTLAGMVRDNANNLYSNEDSTPIVAFQHNYFREGYFKGTLSVHHGNQEWKGGVESDATFLHEQFNYRITDPDQFDEGTPNPLSFAEQRPDLEQSAFVEDLVRLGEWTVSAGLRWDHYQLLLNQSAFSPRLSVGRYLPKANMVLHAAYDRVFQTPSFENILLSSSPQVASLNPRFLRLPVQPSKGNYYEGGLIKGFSEKLRVSVNFYRRDARNFADDDQLLNTGVSYPIAFDKAVIYGAEGKLDVVQWGKLTGFVSYSYMVGNAWFPVTGGLFLGDDAGNAESELAGHFPVSQDQRNTLRTRFKYELMPRLWVAGGLTFGSGLPFEYGGTEEMALAQYGPQVVDRLNFERGRVDPALAVSASVGADLIKSEKCVMRIQVDGDNLNNRLNVLDFGGLFSGNAIAPGRSVYARLSVSF
ncbi:TonB-dependent receptor [Tunturibacter empetritectus]|uniref:Outer membrane receptor for Fe3+-dicitrate n=1 Tax=Tunturiibacter lichenicola TaxID=2051959 RepID=A0A7W8N274_9BACT|nr:TonB-dependent receptor [Edaphobacter lichenicola]MBB5342754.1 outer membrane receptor for Fe3+-dicitrate [Edaphobacter lichenicola]